MDPKAVILKHLTALADDLGQFEQTTHGILDVNIDAHSIGEALFDCLASPSAYTISTLSQVIRHYAKKQ